MKILSGNLGFSNSLLLAALGSTEVSGIPTLSPLTPPEEQEKFHGVYVLQMVFERVHCFKKGSLYHSTELSNETVMQVPLVIQDAQEQDIRIMVLS